MAARIIGGLLRDDLLRDDLLRDDRRRQWRPLTQNSATLNSEPPLLTNPNRPLLRRIVLRHLRPSCKNPEGTPSHNMLFAGRLPAKHVHVGLIRIEPNGARILQDSIRSVAIDDGHNSLSRMAIPEFRASSCLVLTVDHIHQKILHLPAVSTTQCTCSLCDCDGRSVFSRMVRQGISRAVDSS